MTGTKRVIIAGGGPVGCVCALVLSKAGVPVTMLEAETAPVCDLRASTFHPPTLDMLAKLGVTDALIAQGLVSPVFQYRDREAGLLAEFDLAAIAPYSDHPFRLQCEQFKLTMEIYRQLKQYPDTQIIFGARFERLEQDGDGVHIDYTIDGAGWRVSGDYLIGADGARSSVRKNLGIEFPGFTYPELFVVASTKQDVSQIVPGLANVSYISDPEEWCALIRAPELWRFLFPVRPETPRTAALTQDYLLPRMQTMAPASFTYEIAHSTLYDVHQRVAETYRKGRVFLAGDSAHINNPLGGMGMNGGIHDAVNLAGKLVDVLTAQAGEETLARYERQRRPIAIEYVQAQTHRNMQQLEERDPKVRSKRQADLKALASDKKRALEIMLQASMINAVNRSQAIA